MISPWVVDFTELHRPLSFSRPLEILRASSPAGLFSMLERVEEASRQGRWSIVVLPYEGAAAFGYATHAPFTAHAALFTSPTPWVYPFVEPPAALSIPVPQIGQEDHARALAAIQAYLQAGESYQVNFTSAASLNAASPLTELFNLVQSRHRFPYAAHLHLEDGGEGRPLKIASFSPELFLCRRGDRLTTGPIKGTRPRSADPVEDARLARELESSPKDRAEHVMIVDMARNDLGRVCRTGSIRVDPLAARRGFSGVHHLESRVHGEQREGVGLGEIMAALFPAASITGAPKHRTMEIIRELEPAPRGIYTGTIGVVRPGGDFIFNVAIRTVTQHGGAAPRMGLGGGIVADSSPGEEWAELGHKGRFVQEIPPPLGLIETMRVEGNGVIPRLERHLARLAASATALGLAMDPEAIRRHIRLMAGRAPHGRENPWILRLALHAGGRLDLTSRKMGLPHHEGLRVRLSPWRVDGRDPLLRHKTTRRDLFDAALAAARAHDCDDALIRNGEGQITEGAIRAILVQVDGAWLAPPLETGTMASLWREEEMEHLQARETPLTLEMVQRAQAIRMGNAVEGGTAVRLLEDESGNALWKKDFL